MNNFGARRRAVGAWMAEEIRLLKAIPLVITLKPVFFSSEEQVNPEVETTEHLYHVPLEVVDHFRRHTRYYVKKLGGLQTIPELPRKRDPRRAPTYTKYSILVGNLEELVNSSLQEIVQPLDQLGPDSPVFSPFQSPVHSPPQSPRRIMAAYAPPNANQPNENQANLPPAWRAINPFKLDLQLDALP